MRRISNPDNAETYESTHGATRRITAAAKMVEMVCERIAAHEGRSLPTRFWNTPEWKDVFRRQTTFAHSLLKIFDAEIIMRTFRANRGVRSLGASFFFTEIESARRASEAEMKRAAESADTPAFDATRPPRSGRSATSSVRSRLSRIEEKKGDGKAAVE